MEQPPSGHIEYQRARFVTVLPTRFLYTPGHFWLFQDEASLWRIGLTKFATRMLGEMVDFGFEVPPQTPVQAGQKLGWIEGFKAVSEIYCVADGVFLGSNPALEKEVTVINKDPQGAGWLYTVQGSPASGCVDAARYAAMLDRVIDELWQKQMGGQDMPA